MASGSAVRSAAPVFRMVRRFPRQMRLPPFRGNIAASGRPSIIMSLGVTYLALLFRFTIAGAAATEAQIKAQVARIRFILDGDAKIDVTPTEWIAISQFWGKRMGQLDNVNNGVLRFDLSRPWDQEIDAQDGPAWGCATGVPGGVGNFTVEIEMAAAAVTIDGIEGFAEYTDATPLGRHLTVRRYQFTNAAVSNDVQFADFIQNVDWSMYCIHIDKGAAPEAAAPIEHILVKVDQSDEIEKIPTGAIENTYRRYGLTKQTGFTHIPFARRGRPLETLPLVAQDMRLILSVGANALNTTNLLCEQLEGVG